MERCWVLADSGRRISGATEPAPKSSWHFMGCSSFAATSTLKMYLQRENRDAMSQNLQRHHNSGAQTAHISTNIR